MKRSSFIFILLLGGYFSVAAQTVGGDCPEISLTGPDGVTIPGNPMTFRAKIADRNAPGKLEYVWSVSAGSIEIGQGTPRIDVETTKEDDGTEIIATVKINGLPPGCSDAASGKGSVIGIHDLFPFDQFGKESRNSLRPRIDNLFFSLTHDRQTEGVIVVRFSRKESRAAKTRYLNDMYDAIVFLRKDLNRVSFVVSEEDGQTSTTLWILPRDVSSDLFLAQGAVLINGEDLRQRLKTLFTKKY